MANEGVSNTKKLMVAIDENDCSRYALEWALNNLSDYISSSTLTIFTAQPHLELGYLYSASLGTTSPDLIKTVQDQQNKAALGLLEEAKNMCVSRGITPETTTDVGEPKEVICEAVEKMKINLLVLGSNNKGALKRSLLGSVSDYCVHNAKCPVLVVKKPA